VAGWWCFTSDDWAIVSDACICLVSRVVITKKYHFKLTIINTLNLIKIYKLNLQKKLTVGITKCVVNFIGYITLYSFDLVWILINYTIEEINANLNVMFIFPNLQST